MKKEYMNFAAVLVVVAAIAFYGGMKFDQYQGQGQKSMQFGQPGARNQAGVAGARTQNNRIGSGAAIGEVIKKDADSMTVRLPNNGGTKLVILPDLASVVRSVEASSTSIIVGKFVVVSGKANTDGSITAQSVQLRDSMPAIDSSAMNGKSAPTSVTNGSAMKQ